MGVLDRLVQVSWRRALTEQPKRKLARATGIPLTRSGRHAKIGRLLMRAVFGK